MVRDLIETAIRMVKSEKMETVKEKAEKLADEAIVNILVPSKKQQSGFKNPFEMLFQNQQNQSQQNDSEEASLRQQRRQAAFQLASGQLEDQVIEIDVEDQSSPVFDLFQIPGAEQMGMQCKTCSEISCQNGPRRENCELKKRERY
jgi:ATP-dependent HslUV protease ATP-binding subunit HslU